MVEIVDVPGLNKNDQLNWLSRVILKSNPCTRENLFAPKQFICLVEQKKDIFCFM